MAQERGNQNAGPEPPATKDEGDPGGRIPEIARRALAVGLSGFFFTEETIRKALGETLPKDWIDFAIDQSARTRKDFLERLSYEIAQSLEKADLASVLRELLEGRTLEVRAEIRLGGKEGEPDAPTLRAALKDTGNDR
jgi:hypothetical protein